MYEERHNLLSKLSMLGKIYPQNFSSFVLGTIVRQRVPLLSPVLNRPFVLSFKLNMKEAEKPLQEYHTIEDIFTRKLKPNSREIQGELVSPADGMWSQGGHLEDGAAIQAKGLYYDTKELVFGPEASPATKKLNFIIFSTIYLAPHNYHRVHSPVSGRLRFIRYIPGDLWPVNEPFVKWLPNLFIRNERMVFDIELEGGGFVHVVMVGALNVGRIVSPFLKNFFSNDYFKKVRCKTFEMEKEVYLKPGDELGTFMLGSTVVLVFDHQAMENLPPIKFVGKRAVRMGESLI